MLKLACTAGTKTKIHIYCTVLYIIHKVPVLAPANKNRLYLAVDLSLGRVSTYVCIVVPGTFVLPVLALNF